MLVFMLKSISVARPIYIQKMFLIEIDFILRCFKRETPS